MKTLCIRGISCVAAIILLFGFSSCKKGEEEPSTDPYVYIPQNQGVQEAQSGAPAESRFTVDQSWQKNYTLQYKYFDLSQSAETVNIRETRIDDAFAAEYTDKGDVLYYKENGSDVDYYMIIKGAENVHSVVKDKSIDDLSSTFMKLSEVSSGMPSLSNVMYMNEENVAGRPCKKYIQRAYQNGKVQETVFVWVDKQFGFAARGESYDAQDKLTVSWELTQFKSGGVSSGAIRVDLNDYTFIEK